ncbi:hypothetical protein BH24ACT22_BH24ACT22_10890 [soil metagenome]
MDLAHPAERLEAACQKLAPIHPDYANLPIEDGFNWTFCLHGASFERLYLVVFRSVRRPTADLDLLKEYDDMAYEEARQSGGLLRYFKGQSNERRECLSFCLWESREQAREAAGGSSHQVAAGIWTEMYEVYDLERYLLTKSGDGDVVLEPLVADHARSTPITL